MNKEALEKYRAKLDKAFTARKCRLFKEKFVNDNFIPSLVYLAVKCANEN